MRLFFGEKLRFRAEGEDGGGTEVEGVGGRGLCGCRLVGMSADRAAGEVDCSGGGLVVREGGGGVGGRGRGGGGRGEDRVVGGGSGEDGVIRGGGGEDGMRGLRAARTRGPLRGFPESRGESGDGVLNALQTGVDFLEPVYAAGASASVSRR